jgi:hypothetical protein
MEFDEQSDDESSDVNEDHIRSKRQWITKSSDNNFIMYLVDDPPTTMSERFPSLDANYWKEAV